jgi:hypothetical protein
MANKKKSSSSNGLHEVSTLKVGNGDYGKVYMSLINGLSSDEKFNTEKNRSEVVKYIKQVGLTDEFPNFNSIPAWRFIGIGKSCWISNNGGELEQQTVDYLYNKFSELKNYIGMETVEMSDEVTPEKPNIQDRIREKQSDLIGFLENILDSLDTKFVTFEWLRKENIAQVHANGFSKYYTPVLSELMGVLSKSGDTDKELQESYSCYKKTEIEKMFKIVKGFVDDSKSYSEMKSSSRKPRAKKIKSSSDKVKGLKYKESDDRYKIASIDPAKIIGSDVVWIFNTKTRKLLMFVTDKSAGLDMKGSTILGFDDEKSSMKTIRKPEEFLKGFARGGKIKLRKLYESVNGKSLKCNGRINKDCIILKEFT